jgi:hypothetical protein
MGRVDSPSSPALRYWEMEKKRQRHLRCCDQRDWGRHSSPWSWKNEACLRGASFSLRSKLNERTMSYCVQIMTAWWGYRGKWWLSHCWGSVNWVHTSGRPYGSKFQNYKLYALDVEPAIPVFEVFSTDMITYLGKDLCTVFFVISRTTQMFNRKALVNTAYDPSLYWNAMPP